MNSNLAIANGGLASNPKFFGDIIADTISRAVNQSGNWNVDGYWSSPASTSPWSRRGGEAPNASITGIFATNMDNGTAYNWASHRTILSGY